MPGKISMSKVQEALYECIETNDIKSLKVLFNNIGPEMTKEALGLALEKPSHFYTNILAKADKDNRSGSSISSGSSSSANSSPRSSSRSITEEGQIEKSMMDPLMYALDGASYHKIKAMPLVKLLLDNGASAGEVMQGNGLRCTTLAHHVPDKLDVYKALLNNLQKDTKISELCFDLGNGTILRDSEGKGHAYLSFFEHAIVKCKDKSEVTKVIKIMQEAGVDFSYKSNDSKEDETAISQLNAICKVPGINRSLVLEAMTQVIKITGDKPKPAELTNLNHTEKLKIEKAASQSSSRCM